VVCSLPTHSQPQPSAPAPRPLQGHPGNSCNSSLSCRVEITRAPREPTQSGAPPASANPMLHRRDAMLRLGQLGLGALSLPALLRAKNAAAAPAREPSPNARRPTPQARSCILLFLWGGPPQQDMWDMKPDAPDGVRSLFKPIR